MMEPADNIRVAILTTARAFNTDDPTCSADPAEVLPKVSKVLELLDMADKLDLPTKDARASIGLYLHGIARKLSKRLNYLTAEADLAQLTKSLKRDIALVGPKSCPALRKVHGEATLALLMARTKYPLLRAQIAELNRMMEG